MPESKAETAESARETAVGRLMTICPHPTPKERRIYAEWIVDALLDAVRADMSPSPATTGECCGTASMRPCGEFCPDVVSPPE